MNELVMNEQGGADWLVTLNVEVKDFVMCILVVSCCLAPYPTI